ncbi:MAG: ChbG/HpnK family deacetylase [Anaerolineae bacterium]|nr:ChbG/HpnK family deacetylase [Anaerolineae bacterium]
MYECRIKLVTRGDDAGMCHTVNIAIRDAVMHGILRYVSMMAPAPAFDEAVEIFSDLPGVKFGLHVDLSSQPYPTWFTVPVAEI